MSSLNVQNIMLNKIQGHFFVRIVFFLRWAFNMFMIFKFQLYVIATIYAFLDRSCCLRHGLITTSKRLTRIQYSTDSEALFELCRMCFFSIRRFWLISRLWTFAKFMKLPKSSTVKLWLHVYIFPPEDMLNFSLNFNESEHVCF